MGGDGGSIPKRAELVKTSKKKEQADKDMERDAKWSHCAITQRELVRPIVACELGKLYNKESILEYLLDKSLCDSITHIRSLKDVKELNLTVNSGYDSKCREAAGHFDTMAAKYICPVAGLEMNGKYRFCFMWSCGCVLSERAMKEVPSEVCHKCGKAFDPENVITLNGDESDFECQKIAMEARRLKAKLEKKSKRSEKISEDLEDKKKNGGDKVDGGKKRASADLSGEKMTSKKLKGGQESSLAKNNSKVQQKTDTVKDTSHLDPKATKVYKNLFTSSESNKNRSKNRTSNWVTYNPYHL